MRFLVITHVEHIKQENNYFAYAPYVQEMNIWLKYVDEVEVVAPVSNKHISNIDISYQHDNILFTRIPSIAFTTIERTIRSLFTVPLIFLKLFNACKKADHIHLRCPGNIGLLGCFVQIVFPRKIKTAKYAGNWDPKSKQPMSYKLQRALLKNEFLTKNMKALVYGDWKDTSKNVVPFFTASYKNSEKEEIASKELTKTINLLFVGTLSPGKQPLLSVKVAHQLLKKEYDIKLDIYGDGVKKSELQSYIKENNLENHVMLHGNKPKEVIKEAYKKAHFLVFISRSEGWPKVVAEAMFWKCLPLSTSVSCIPEMLDYGNRGSIITNDISQIVGEISNYIEDQSLYQQKVIQGYNWSRNYTLDTFETEIKNLLLE